VAEYLDLELAAGAELEVGSLPARLSAALPEGVDAVAAATIEAGAPSLQEEVTSCTWSLAVASADGRASADSSGLAPSVERVLDADRLVVTRLRKGTEVTDDIRPAILSIRLLDEAPDGVRLECDLATRPRSLRPSELVAALGPGLEEREVRRLHQWIERDGARWEPLSAPPAATDAPHALERAS
jgi:hypothetical protein